MTGERLIRHSTTARILHWVMALATLGLLATGLSGVLGGGFAWVAPHWITGLVLTLGVLWHLLRFTVWRNLRRMAVGRRDLRLGGTEKPGKYAPAQKLMHHGIALFTLLALATGLVMMVKVDTPLWPRDPYFLSAAAWGVIYVLHGLATLCLVSLVMLHVYFALRPEKLFYTRSMVKGWITGDELRQNHDPDHWKGTPT